MKKILIFVLLLSCVYLYSCDYIHQRSRKKEIQDSIVMFNDSLSGIKDSIKKLNSEIPNYDFYKNRYDSLLHKEGELRRKLEYNIKYYYSWYYSYSSSNNYEYFIDNQNGERYDSFYDLIDAMDYDINEHLSENLRVRSES